MSTVELPAATPLIAVLADLPPAPPGSVAAEARALSIGRKALSLSELAGAGVSVPPAVVVTTAAYHQVLASGAVATALEAARHASPDDEVALAAMRQALCTAPLPDHVEQEIIAGYHALGSGTVAVRSSGTSEDLEGASFAGLYETFLSVAGDSDVVSAVRRCWASAWTERVAVYAAHNGLALDALDMGVAIQRQIDADVSGVLFTIDPAGGLQEQMRIESCFGLGEALVGGLITPDQFVVDRRGGAALESTVAGDEPTLDPAQLGALAAAGRRIQALYGQPQDIEWVVEGGQLWIVQSRPVTAISFDGIEGEWTTADFKDGGVSARVCSPYMWSLYDHIWQDAMPSYLRTIKLLRHDDPVVWGRVFYGRPYWNVGEVKRVLHRVPGFNERSFDSDLGIEPLYDGDGTVIPFTPVSIARALPTLFALEADYKRRLELDRAFVDGFAERLTSYETPPADLDSDALFERYRRLVTVDYTQTETAYFKTIFNTSNAKIDFKSALDKLNKRTPKPVAWLSLLSGLSDMRHLDPLHDLWQLAGRVIEDPPLHELIVESKSSAVLERLSAEHPTFRAELDAFLAKYKHHGIAELDITQPRWDEDPSFVIDTLRTYVIGHDPERSPSAMSARQRALYEAELDVVNRHFDGLFRFGRRGFLGKLQRVRTYLWWREEMRDCSSKLYALIRQETLEVARRLVSAGTLGQVEDVWFLRWPEVLDLLDATLEPSEARQWIEERREELAGWRDFTNPNELGRRFAVGASRTATTDEGGLQGIPCSAGQVTARVRVVPTIQDAVHLQAGEILVTRFTDPGWTTLFSQIAGVVTETGGVLSHAAVIAREYGIPAVLAVPKATRELRDGQWVRLDGNAGTVTPIAEP